MVDEATHDFTEKMNRLDQAGHRPRGGDATAELAAQQAAEARRRAEVQADMWASGLWRPNLVPATPQPAPAVPGDFAVPIVKGPYGQDTLAPASRLIDAVLSDPRGPALVAARLAAHK